MNRRDTLIGLGALTLAGCATRPQIPPGLEAGAQKQFTIDGLHLGRMWISLPSDYLRRSGPWPLLVFLHGSGECGTDLDAVLRNGPPLQASQGKPFPFVLCSPQLPEGEEWQADQLHALLRALQQRFDVDPARSLATGLSLGGFGVWNWACAYPDDLAAIVPICGYGDPARVPAMRKVPVRAYHGGADPVVPLASHQACVDALRAAGGTVSFTVYPGVGHGSWVPAYEDAGLIPWLLAQKKAV